MLASRSPCPCNSSALKKYPISLVAYELMNEPVADDAEQWNKLVEVLVRQIRRDEPHRKIVIGSNKWQSSATWPPATARPVTYYLASGGQANSLFGDGRQAHGGAIVDVVRRDRVAIAMTRLEHDLASRQMAEGQCAGGRAVRLLARSAWRRPSRARTPGTLRRWREGRW